MTREEAKQWIELLTRTMRKETSGSYPDPLYKDEVYVALDMAIEALEQQPCEDCISRQAVLEQINCWIGSGEYRYTNATHYLTRRMQELPSVTPRPKIGRWIEHFDESGKWYECDQCHTDWGGPVNYCPNCGCAMGVDKR